MEESGLPMTPARFSDRLNAFLLDASLFASAYFVTVMIVLLVLRGKEPPSFFYAAWATLWTVLFVVYHAYLGAEGRQTLGKKAFGLLLSTTDGKGVEFKKTLLRTFGYALSSLPLYFGFLWALRKDGRAWHDLIAGTRVVEIAPKGRLRRRLGTISAWVLASALAVSWFGLVVIGPGMARMKLLAHARTGLKSLAYLEDRYKLMTGAYTADPAVLFRSSTDASQMSQGLPFFLNMKTIRISVQPDSYSIEAEALDEERTVMRFAGPVQELGYPASGAPETAPAGSTPARPN
jgi:uncharacterized RDD family membrane protein YckC